MQAIQLQFARIKRILLEPVRFFKGEAITMSLNEALAIGLTCHWIGFSAQSFWNLIFKEFFSSKLIHFDYSDIDGAARIPFLDQFLTTVKSGFSDSFISLGWILFDPFKTLFLISIKSLIFFAMARLLISDSERPRWVTVETVLKITSIALIPSIFSFIPFFGSVISGIGGVYIIVIGFKEYFSISASRALLITFFPWLLMAGFLMLGVLSLGVAAMSFFL